jgi:hypothetical protein
VPNNPHRITLQKFWNEMGVETQDEKLELLDEYFAESICPALCDEGCEVEPDGHCPHGCPSMLLIAGLV